MKVKARKEKANGSTLRDYGRSSVAASIAIMRGVANAQLRTLLRVLVSVFLILVPTLADIQDWPAWFWLPVPSDWFLGFHILSWWTAAVVGTVGWETYQRTSKAVQWQAYWNERGRIVGGNLDEIGSYLLHKLTDGPKPSTNQIGSDILSQIAQVVIDLTQPPEHVHIMACVLVPETDASGEVVALQALIYNQNAGRNGSRIPISVPGPACEAYKSATGRPVVVPDTTAEPYRSQFEGKPYKSVVGFPVDIGRKGGHRVAVVTVDATEPNFFSDDVVESKGLEAAVYPYLKMVGLLRVAEQRGTLRGKR